MDKECNLLTVDDYLNIVQIANNEKLSFADALEEYTKRNPGKVKNLGTLHEDGKLTQIEISEDGVETKEVDFSDELEKNWTEMLEERDLLDNE